MKIRKVFIGCLVLSSILVSAQFKKITNSIENLNNQASEITLKTSTKKQLNLENISTFDDVLNYSIDELPNYLPEYLDITGLNVTEKTSINLESYNYNYIVPTEEELSISIFDDMYESFSESAIEVFEELREDDYNYDEFFTLIENDFIQPEIETKYSAHRLAKRSLSSNDPVSNLNNLLLSVGLSAAAITVLVASASVLVSTAPVAWCIPYSVPATIAALLCIVTVILINWNLICQIFEAMVNLFIECIQALANVVRDFFDWIYSQVQTSSVSSTITIGTETFQFQEIKTNDVSGTLAIVTACRRSNNVFLMQYVKTDSFQIALGTPVTEQFCISNGTHRLGYSSYTWYQNVARRLITRAGSGITTNNPEMHVDSTLPFGFKHFHNCKQVGGEITRITQSENALYHRTHSMFGLLYYYGLNTTTNQMDVICHPGNPQP